MCKKGPISCITAHFIPPSMELKMKSKITEFIRQYHGCSPILQRSLPNKLQATQCYINRSHWYLFRRTRCKTGSNHDIAVYSVDPCVMLNITQDIVPLEKNHYSFHTQQLPFKQIVCSVYFHQNTVSNDNFSNSLFQRSLNLNINSNPRTTMKYYHENPKQADVALVF